MDEEAIKNFSFVTNKISLTHMTAFTIYPTRFPWNQNHSKLQYSERFT